MLVSLVLIRDIGNAFGLDSFFIFMFTWIMDRGMYRCMDVPRLHLSEIRAKAFHFVTLGRHVPYTRWRQEPRQFVIRTFWKRVLFSFYCRNLVWMVSFVCLVGRKRCENS
jgi:hypothetical protein